MFGRFQVFGGSASSKEGRVMGRYLDNTYPEGGPTGRVEGRFAPPPDPVTGEIPPPMLVIEDYIFAGWFNFIFLTDVSFTYKVDGKPLFERMNLASFTSASTSVAKFNLPTRYRQGQSAMDVENESDVALGFFGPSVTTAATVQPTACYPQGQFPLDGIWQNISGTSTLIWDG